MMMTIKLFLVVVVLLFVVFFVVVELDVDVAMFFKKRKENFDV